MNSNILDRNPRLVHRNLWPINQLLTKPFTGAMIYIILFLFLSLSSACQASQTAPEEQFPTEHISILPYEDDTNGYISETGISAGQYLRFDRISLDQGLSQSTVFCMLQDSQGFMWFGTEDGLNKFDGINFTVYKHDPDNPNSLSDNWILSLFEDQSGTLWVGTREGGLNRYNRRSDQFSHFQNNPGDPSSISENEITTISQDREGSLWIGTGDGGLNQYNPEEGIFTNYQNNPGEQNTINSNAVTRILEDQNGLLWIGTENNGLSTYDRESGQWHHYTNDPADPTSLSHNTIKSIIEDSSGAMWFGTVAGGLDQYDPERDRFIHIQKILLNPDQQTMDAIAVIFQDQDGMIWVGTEGSGLFYIDPVTEEINNLRFNSADPNSLSSNYITTIIEDREGVIWFGTYGGGINKLGLGRKNFKHYLSISNDPNSLSDNMIRTFSRGRENNLWVGTLIKGLDRFDRENESWQHFSNDPEDSASIADNFISVLYEDNKGNLWIGTASGLDRLEIDTGSFTHYQNNPDDPPSFLSNNVRTLFESSSNQFWIGTKAGLFQFDSEQERWAEHYKHDPDDPNSLSDNWIFSSIEDREGNIWLGTVDGGLNRFDPETGTFTRYMYDLSYPQGLSNNFVMSIFQDSTGVLWIGTPGGLDRFDPETETFLHYREKDGLPNNTVYCILEDSLGFLWLSTNKGLSRFDSQAEEFKNYDVYDGLQSNEFNGNACSMVNKEEMVFGGINGFNIFSPMEIRDNPKVPPIVLTSFTQDGKDLDLEVSINSLDEISFNWPNNGFEFEFAALSYSNPTENQYAYMLEGFDDDWIEIGTQRYGKYTNLPGGKYTLRLIGSNNDGIWNEEGYSVDITVIPPLWSTWWVQAILVFCAIGLFYAGFRLRVRNIEIRSNELEHQVEERTSELKLEIDQRLIIEETLRAAEMEKVVTEERSRLARDLHDSVTQSLYSLTLFTEAVRFMLKEDGDDEIEQTLGQIGTIGLQALKEMRLLVFELQPSELKKEGLISALRSRIEAVEARAGIEATIFVDEIFKLPEDIEMEFFLFAQEALNNALKHAEANSVEINFNRKIGKLEMEIIDDGIGFDTEALPDRGGMGIKNFYERGERVNGVVEIRSKIGEGTSVKISVDYLEDSTLQGARDE